jgi:hypothetical protein
VALRADFKDYCAEREREEKMNRKYEDDMW